MKTIYKLTDDELKALRTLAYVQCDNVDCLDCPFNINACHCISSSCADLLKIVDTDGVYDATKKEVEDDDN